MSVPRICAALVGVGVLALFAAVLFGPSTPGTYCIYAAMVALGLAAALFVLYVIAALCREYADS
jgi:hypothetical protein